MISNVLETVQKRYTAKHYDPSRKISPEDWAKVEEILRLAPSSVNYQPVEYFVASTEAARAKVAKAVLSFNAERVLKASHVVVFTVPLDARESHLKAVLEKEDLDGRYANPELKNAQDQGRRHFVGLHQISPAEITEWFTRQAYLACGFVVMATAEAGIDSTIMEGFDFPALDRELGLREKGLASMLVVSFGYHADNDGNAIRPKSRLARDLVIHEL